MKTEPTALYRPFLREAWRLTWQRKSLWVFGIFASLISTGGVVDAVIASFRKVKTAGTLLEGFAQSSFIGYDLAAQYIRQMALLGSTRMTALLIAATLVGVLLVVVATLAQGGLILGLVARKAEDPYALKLKAATHFWSLLTVAIMNRLASALLMLLMALPLFAFYLATSTRSAVIFFILMLLLIPALIALHIIYQFTLFGIVQRGLHVPHAIAQAARLFARHWLATLEFGIMLFALVLAALTLMTAALALLTVPYALIFSATLLTGSFPLFLAANILSVFVLITLLLCFIGAAVTFQYAAWLAFYRHGLHRVHGKKVFSKILRLAYQR